jgi:hypothetical protein
LVFFMVNNILRVVAERSSRPCSSTSSAGYLWSQSVLRTVRRQSLGSSFDPD